MALKVSIKRLVSQSNRQLRADQAEGASSSQHFDRWVAWERTRPLPCSCQRKLEPSPFADTGHILLLSQGNCKYDWTHPNGSCTEVQGQGKKKHADKQGRNESLDRQEWTSVSSRYLETLTQIYTLCKREKQKPASFPFNNVVIYWR